MAAITDVQADIRVSWGTAFPTRLHACPAKTAISLHILTVWSESLQGSMLIAKGPKVFRQTAETD